MILKINSEKCLCLLSDLRKYIRTMINKHYGMTTPKQLSDHFPNQR
jgi:hypothetical protein